MSEETLSDLPPNAGIGDRILHEIIKQNMVSYERVTENTGIFVWAGNASEQLESVVHHSMPCCVVQAGLSEHQKSDPVTAFKKIHSLLSIQTGRDVAIVSLDNPSPPIDPEYITVTYRILP